jgi:6,7-dimethyl-8-ribityllumazine synthase
MFEHKKVDAVVAVGSVIQGETKHFDFVCEACAQGVKDVSLKYNKPAVFCVLTDNTMQQAIDRSGGKHGNKGVEAGIAALKMAALQAKLK